MFAGGPPAGRPKYAATMRARHHNVGYEPDIPALPVDSREADGLAAAAKPNY
jgi:hypothetical protein